MIQRTIVSFFDNFKQKTTNPFLGTLIIVWVYRNYENFYVLFFSRSSTRYSEKTEALHGLFKTEHFLGSFFVTIGITVLVLIGTYILLNLSRLIVNFSNKKVTPWVYKITDESSIVLKKDYDKLYEDRESLQKRFEEQRKETFRIESELNTSVKEKNEIIEQRDTINEKYQNLLDSPSRTIGSDILTEKTKLFDDILSTLDKGNMISDFEVIELKISEGTQLRNSPTNELLKKWDIIQSLGETKYYRLTPKGEELKDYYYLKKQLETKNNQNTINIDDLDLVDREDLIRVETAIDNIIKREYSKDFETLIYNAEHKTKYKINDAIKYFVSIGILTRDRGDEFKFTDFGEFVKRQYKIDHLS